ncbi:MAG: hypothetical protein V1781_05925 [Bacteroidota bacterium]
MRNINYISHSHINKKTWDECIEHSQNSLIYAYSWYLDIVCPNWEALVEGDYESVMPLTWEKKYGIRYLFQPYFTQQLGIFSKNKLEKKTIEKFLLSIPTYYKFIEINLNTQNDFQSNEYSSKKKN